MPLKLWNMGKDRSQNLIPQVPGSSQQRGPCNRFHVVRIKHTVQTTSKANNPHSSLSNLVNLI